MTDILFFSSPIGLGHATRDYAICQHLSEFSIKFVSGIGAAQLLSTYNLDVYNIYRPPMFVTNEGSLRRPLRWIVEYVRYYMQCKKIAKKIILKEKPKIIVSDEDFASLAVSQKSMPTVLITDILETKFTHGIASILERKMNQSMKDIISKCSRVIIPYHGEDHNNKKHVGPIVRQIENTREELRKRFGFTKKTLVISVGGTDAGIHLIKKALIAAAGLDIDTVVISGPSIREQFHGSRNLGFVNNLHEVIFAADVLVSLAGRSTIDEAALVGTPAIFIPIKGHFEQEDNARSLGFSYDDINRLDLLIQEKLEQKRNPKPFNGSKKAAHIIKEVLQSNN